ncbi:hypothetical protein [Frankia sp. AgKG'84/4]
MTEPKSPRDDAPAGPDSTRTATAVVTASLSLACVSALAGLGVPGLTCVAAAGVGFAAVVRTLSRLVVVYVTVVAIGIVVAGRIVSADALLVPSAVPAPDGFADTCAGLWISVAVTAGALSAHLAGRRMARLPTSCPAPITTARLAAPVREGSPVAADVRRRARSPMSSPTVSAQVAGGRDAARRMTVAVLAAAGLAAAGQAYLVAAGSLGVSAQYAGGTTGGGYLGLLAAVGPLLAGAALLATSQRHSPSPGLRGLAWLEFLAHAGLLVLTGFRGAAPALCLATLLAAGATAGTATAPGAPAAPGVGVGNGQRRDGGRVTLARRAGVVAAAVAAIGGLFVAGSSVRAGQAASAGYQSTTPGSLAEVVIRRLDYRPYLLRALEVKDDPEVRSVVALRDQAGVLVPRLLYPGKPTADQGRRISHAVFDLPADLPTSSTITAFGDGVVNLGLVGAMGLLGVWVLVLDGVFRRVAGAASVSGYALRIALLETAFDTAPPPILQLATAVRTLCAVGVVLMLLATITRGRRRIIASPTLPRPLSATARTPAGASPVRSPP